MLFLLWPQVLPPAELLVSEVWPLVTLIAGGAVGAITTLSGLFYKSLLGQIDDLKKEKGVLQETIKELTVASQINPQAANALVLAIRDLGETIDERLPPAPIPHTTTRRRPGGD